MYGYRNMLKVVHSRAPEVFVGKDETQRTHQMKGCAGSGTQASDVAGVVRDFGFDQNDLQRM